MGASARRGPLTMPTGMFDCHQHALRHALIRDCWLSENVSPVSVLYFSHQHWSCAAPQENDDMR